MNRAWADGDTKEKFYDELLDVPCVGSTVVLRCDGRLMQTSNVQEVDDEHPGRFRTMNRWYSPKPKDKNEGR